jgi:FAD/FMN-containing dehydrogenase
MQTNQLIDELQTTLRGKIIQPHDDGYDNARKVFNGMIDKRPLCIVQCVDVADVISSVNFARENKMLLAVKGGGHSATGLGMCNDGMVIDLSLMKGIFVDVQKQIVTLQAGCTLGDLDHATHAFGLAVPSGVMSTTGISGLTLGGGLGHLTRKYGLAIDNLLQADIVTADGSYLTASSAANEDLFWALRGGGGNFGVVTSFVFRLQPVKMVFAGPMMWEMDEASDILKWYRKFIVNAPDDLAGFFAFLTVPPNPHFPEHLQLKKMCAIIWCYTGPLEKANEFFEPIRKFKTPALDLAGPMPFPVLQRLFDPVSPPGMQSYWKPDFFKELSDQVIALHVQHAAKMPTWMSGMHLYPVNGAASRIGQHDTAWNHRDATFAMVILGVDADPANKERLIQWAKEYWEAIHPYSAGGGYVNFMMEEGDDRIKETYGDNYDRLTRIKHKYDPENLFRVNQNIKPTASKA